METNTGEAKIKILVADDHPVFRRGLVGMLDSMPQFEVVGQAANGEEVVKLARELVPGPDVILMDMKMPRLNGIEATTQIMAHNPAIRVLVISMLDDDTVFAAMRAGARGYLIKEADQDEIVSAIETVSRGGVIFSPGVAGRIMEMFPVNNRQAALTSLKQPAKPPGPVGEEEFPDLTVREREILNLIASGVENEEIAERLVISLKTVRNHVSNIFAKLEVVNRSQAVIKARESGFGYGNSLSK